MLFDTKLNEYYHLNYYYSDGISSISVTFDLVKSSFNIYLTPFCSIYFLNEQLPDHYNIHLSSLAYRSLLRWSALKACCPLTHCELKPLGLKKKKKRSHMMLLVFLWGYKLLYTTLFGSGNFKHLWALSLFG